MRQFAEIEKKMDMEFENNIRAGWGIGLLTAFVLFDARPDTFKKVAAAFILDDALLQRCSDKAVAAMREMTTGEDVLTIVNMIIEEYNAWIELRKAAGL